MNERRIESLDRISRGPGILAMLAAFVLVFGGCYGAWHLYELEQERFAAGEETGVLMLGMVAGMGMVIVAGVAAVIRNFVCLAMERRRHKNSLGQAEGAETIGEFVRKAKQTADSDAGTFVRVVEKIDRAYQQDAEPRWREYLRVESARLLGRNEVVLGCVMILVAMGLAGTVAGLSSTMDQMQVAVEATTAKGVASPETGIELLKTSTGMKAAFATTLVGTVGGTILLGALGLCYQAGVTAHMQAIETAVAEDVLPAFDSQRRVDQVRQDEDRIADRDTRILAELREIRDAFSKHLRLAEAREARAEAREKRAVEREQKAQRDQDQQRGRPGSSEYRGQADKPERRSGDETAGSVGTQDRNARSTSKEAG